jgi:hypothetical protein
MAMRVLDEPVEDQSFPEPFVKGIAGIAAIAGRWCRFLTAARQNRQFTGSLLAESRQLWPVWQPNRFC